MITKRQFEMSLAIIRQYYKEITRHQEIVKNTIEHIEKCNPETNICDLDLGVRAYNILRVLISRKFGNVTPTIHHVISLTEHDIISAKGAGQSILSGIISTLAYYGYSLSDKDVLEAPQHTI